MDATEVYKQQYAHFGRLNETLYKMPSVFAAVIGGLWYFATGYLEKDWLIAAVVFVFSGAVGAASAVAVHRFRLAFKAYLNRINAFDGPHKVTIHSRVPSTLRVMTWLMCLAIAMSLGGAVYAAVRRPSHSGAAPRIDGGGHALEDPQPLSAAAARLSAMGGKDARKQAE